MKTTIETNYIEITKKMNFLNEDVQKYFEREVRPHVPEAWIDHSKTKIGYEINFTKYYYEFKPLRALSDIKADILALEKETDGLIQEVIK